MKRSTEVMEILEAFDLTGSYRAAAALAGCDHKTVARYVRERERGQTPGGATSRRKRIDPHLAKLEEWVERSGGKVRADIVHRKLTALGFEGSERTTRRAVARARRAYAAGHRRIYRPWVPEPGMWLQFDWGAGPRINGRPTLLWCAWLAWSRFRVVIPTRDRVLGTVVACLDETLRRIGGAPTYGLTDNEKTVTIDRVAARGRGPDPRGARLLRARARRRALADRSRGGRRPAHPEQDGPRHRPSRPRRRGGGRAGPGGGRGGRPLRRRRPRVDP